MHPFRNLNRAISHPVKPLISFLFTSPSGISAGHNRSTEAFIFSDSNTKTTTLDFFVPRPKVSVCHAWWARMVKFVGRKAEAEAKADLVGGRERRRRSSRGRARRIVKDLTMNWPPNRRPFTSEEGLNEKSEVVLAVWSLGCWCFCFLFLFLFLGFSSMEWWWPGGQRWLPVVDGGGRWCDSGQWFFLWCDSDEWWLMSDNKSLAINCADATL